MNGVDYTLFPAVKFSLQRIRSQSHSNEKLVACYQNVPLTTSAGICKVSSIQGGSKVDKHNELEFKKRKSKGID